MFCASGSGPSAGTPRSQAFFPRAHGSPGNCARLPARAGSHFREREAEILGPLDEPDSLHAVFGISPDAVQGPLRFRDQASALIVADGLDVHTGGTRKAPDGEVSIHEFHSLTPYCGTAIRIRLSTFAARTATRRAPARTRAAVWHPSCYRDNELWGFTDGKRQFRENIPDRRRARGDRRLRLLPGPVGVGHRGP